MRRVEALIGEKRWLPLLIAGAVIIVVYGAAINAAKAQNYWQELGFKARSAQPVKVSGPAGRTAYRLAGPRRSQPGLLETLFGIGSSQSDNDYASPFSGDRLGSSGAADPYGNGMSPWNPNQRYGGQYRTMCVRLCDGYYFPVSFQTDGSSFDRDAAVCQSRCNAPAKLFYYNNPGEDVENMRDLEGHAYRDLKTAFRYRKEYVADCRCQPDPWSHEARRRHQAYAALETGKPLPEDQMAVAELPQPKERKISKASAWKFKPSFDVRAALQTVEQDELKLSLR